jgi:hypothetical protein
VLTFLLKIILLRNEIVNENKIIHESAELEKYELFYLSIHYEPSVCVALSYHGIFLMKLHITLVTCTTNISEVFVLSLLLTPSRRSGKESVSLPKAPRFRMYATRMTGLAVRAVCRPPWTIAVPGSVKFAKCGSWRTTSLLVPTEVANTSPPCGPSTKLYSPYY